MSTTERDLHVIGPFPLPASGVGVAEGVVVLNLIGGRFTMVLLEKIKLENRDRSFEDMIRFLLVNVKFREVSNGCR